MMQEQNDKQLRLADLIAKFIKGELSSEESEELEAWLDADPKNREMFAEMNDPALQKVDFDHFSKKDLRGDWNKISLKIEERNSTKTNSYKWWAIAASVLLILSIAGWWLMRNKNDIERSKLAEGVEQDIYPGSYTATLIDGNGVSHHLFQNSNDTIGNYATNTAAGLTYLHKNNLKDSNTLIIPVKGMFHITLEDGTEVWLHPSSTLKYPVCFVGNERKVILTGDAYFKVAKNPSMPFRVYCKGVITEAVGTEFDINGYSDSVTTSLVQGVVHIITSKGSITMAAGNSMSIVAGMMPTQMEKLDTSLAESWKNGDFNFRQTRLTDVMTTLSGWYGVKLTFSKQFDWTKKIFNGRIPRNIPLSDVLQILTMTNIAKFEVSNNTIFIYPYQTSPD